MIFILIFIGRDDEGSKYFCPDLLERVHNEIIISKAKSGDQHEFVSFHQHIAKVSRVAGQMKWTKFNYI